MSEAAVGLHPSHFLTSLWSIAAWILGRTKGIYITVRQIPQLALKEALAPVISAFPPWGCP